MLDIKSFQLHTFLPLPYEEVLAPRLKGPSAPGL